MPTTSLFHAALSAAAVGLLLTTLRRAGPRAAGLGAAVPISSLPALFWLSLEQGGRFATSAVLGSLYGTGLTVLLGALFARLAVACPAPLAALLAWLAVGALAVLTWGVAAVPAAIALLALAVLAVGRLALPPAPAGDTRPGTGERARAWLPMAAAGSMSLVVSELSRHAGAQFCGLLAALPVVGMITVQAGSRRGGPTLALRVLHGYLDGMTAKAAFLGALGAAWALGAGPWAWALALAAAAAALAAQHATSSRAGARAARRGPPRPSARTATSGAAGSFPMRG